jgi:hypothetical protein
VTRNSRLQAIHDCESVVHDVLGSSNGAAKVLPV